MKKFSFFIGLMFFALFAVTHAVYAQPAYRLNETFDFISSGLPVNWDNSDGTTTTSSYKWNLYAVGYTGNCMRFDSYNNPLGNTNMLKTPLMDLSIGDWILKFKYKNPNGGDFSVYISTDGGATYTNAICSGLTAQGNWTSMEIPISNTVTSPTVKIVFKGTSNHAGGDAYIYLDEVSVESVLTCKSAVGIFTQDITRTGATLSWGLTAEGDIPASYKYTLMDAAGNTIESNQSLYAPNQQYTIAATLTPNTTYTASIQSDCSAEHSGYGNMASITFTTLCDVQDAPYFQNFDAVDDIPECSFGNNVLIVSPGHQGQGLGLATSIPEGAYIVFPEIDIPSNNAEISFWIKSSGVSTPSQTAGTGYSKFQIGIVSDPSDVGSSFEILYYDSLATTDWREIHMNTTGSTTPVTSSTFLCLYALDGFNRILTVDDVFIRAVPTCIKPEQLTCSNVSYDQVTLSWTSSNANSYLIKATSLYDSTVITAYATQSPYIMTGLAPNTEYEFTVQGICSANDLSDVSKPDTAKTLCSVTQSTIFMEDAEGTTDENLPDCWTTGTIKRTAGDQSSDSPFATQTSSTNKRGTRGFKYNNMASGNISYLCSPALNFDQNGKYSFRFEYYRPSGSTASYKGEGLKVFVTPTAGDTTNAVEVIPFVNRLAAFPPANTSGWNTYEGIINYQGTGYIMIVGYSKHGSASYFDNLEVFLTPSCPKVSHITVGNVTKNSVELSWIPGNTENKWIVDYDLKVGANVFRDTTVVVTGQPNLIISDLASASTYTISAAVRACCGTGDTAEAVTATAQQFVTMCDILSSLPYTMGFEDNETYIVYNTYRHPLCWTLYNSLSSTTSNYHYYPYTNTSNSHSGGKSLYNYSSSGATYADTAIFSLPEIDTTIYAINELRVKFWAKQGSASNSQIIYVGAMADPNNPATFVKIDSAIVTGTTFVEYILNLSQYSGNTKFIAIAWFKSARLSNASGIYMDDLTIEPIPTCSDLAGSISINAITDSSVTFSLADLSATDWQYAYGLAGTRVTQMTPVSQSGPTCTITGLTETTTYDIYVRRDCGNNDFGSWSTSFRFTTTAVPAQMPYACGFEDAQENARWQYVDGAGANVFSIGNNASAIFEGSNALYVTNDRTNVYYTYNTSSATKSYAYRAMHFDAKGYQVEFKFKATGGESGHDFGRIFLVPMNEVLIAGATGSVLASTTFPSISAEFDGEYQVNATVAPQLNVATASMGTVDAQGWHTVSYLLDMTYRPGDYNFVAMWNNDQTSGSSSYPLSLDDINIYELTCIPPSVVIIDSLTAHSANLNIQQSSASQWEVIVADCNFNKYSIPNTLIYRDIVDTPIVSLTGLAANTTYYYMIRSICNTNDTSDWSALSQFHTFCSKVEIPFHEDFENVNSTNCWSQLGTIGSIGRTTNYHNNGLACMKADAVSVITPELDVISLAADMINGWCYSTEDSTEFVIGVMTDPNDVSTYIDLTTIFIPTKNNWIEFTSYFTALNDPEYSAWVNAKYIVITVSTDQVVYFDDLNIDATPTCPKPTDISIYNITANSFDISFVSNTPNSTKWAVYTNGIPNIITTNPATISGLKSHFTYDVSIAAICSNNDTSYTTDCGRVTTDCAIFATPYSCGFESYEGFSNNSAYVEGALEANCWSTLNMSNSFPFYFTNSEYFHGGSQGLKGTSSKYQYAYLILPALADPTNTLMISFWYRTESTSINSPFVEIGYMTDATDESTFVLIHQLPKIATMTKVEQSFVNPNIPANSRIVIRYGGGPTSGYYCGIDDITVKVVRNCPDPFEPVIDNITTTSADINFVDTCSAHTDWEYVYGLAGFDPNSATPTHIDTTSFSIYNLEGETDYDVYVRAICSVGDESNFIKSSFKTLCGPFKVTSTHIFVEDFSDYDFGMYLHDGTCFDILGETNNSINWAYIYPTSDPYEIPYAYRYCYGNSDNISDKCFYWSFDNSVLTEGSILRQFHLEAGQTYEISAWVRNGVSNNYDTRVDAVVGTSTDDLTTLSSIDLVGEVVYPDLEDGYYYYHYNRLYQQLQTFITPENTGDYYIGFNASFGNGYTYTYLFLDDWTVKIADGCTPRIPNIDSVTTNTAYISITDSDYYKYEYVLNDTTLVATDADSNIFAINGLNASSYYTLYVRRYCDATTHTKWIGKQFTTECAVITEFPYTQDFEGQFMPACWSQNSYGSYTNAWQNSINQKHSGSYSAYIPDKYAGAKTGLSTGMLYLTSPNGYEVSLWVFRSNSSYRSKIDEAMHIYVYNTPVASEEDVAAATEIGVINAHYTNEPVELSSGWYEYTFTIPPSCHGFNYLTITYHNQHGSGSYFDDLKITELPPCREPKDAPSVTATTMTTMAVHANMAGKDTIEFGIAPYSSDVTSSEISTTIISTDGYGIFNGLAGNTRYAVWYRYYCGNDGISEWSKGRANATTMLSDCFEAQNLRVVGIVSDRHAELTWGAAPDVYLYEYELYRGTNDNDTLIYSATTAVHGDTIVFDSLTASTDYYFRVRGFCQSDTTAWVGTSFQTTRTTAYLPFICNFENNADAALWETGNNSNSNSFVIGTGTNHGGNKSLYVSNNGSSYQYLSSESEAYARILLPLPAGVYHIQYDYICHGENGQDYGRIFLYPAANAVGCITDLSLVSPSGNINLAPSEISGMENWATADYIVTIPFDAMYYFQTNWVDNDSYEGGNPLAIDNILIEEIVCMPLSGLSNIASTSHNAKFVATRYAAGLDIQYGYSTVDSKDSIQWTTIHGTGMSDTIAISNLMANTTYYLFAREICDSAHISPATRVVFTTPDVAQPLPFICNFEADESSTDAWRYAGSNNQFVVGTATSSSGSSSMYISDDANSWNYDVDNASNSYAYVPLEFSPGTYDIEYDWHGFGESTLDYGRVFLAPASFVPTAGIITAGMGNTGTPTGWIALDDNNRLNLATSWTNVSQEQTFNDSTTMNLLVFWHDNSSGGTQPPFAIDNIRITMQSCRTIQQNTITIDTIGETFMTIRYLNPNYGASTKWIISSNSQLTDTIAMGIQSAVDSSFTVSNLSGGYNYYIALYSICGTDDISKACKFNVRTKCSPMTQFPYNESFETFTPQTYNLLTDACWATTEMNSSLYAAANANTGASVGGHQGLLIYNGTSSENIQILALPEMSGLNGKTISFWHKAYNNSSAYNTMSFGYINSVNQFVSLHEFSDKTTSWREYETTIQNLPAGVTRLAFKFVGNYFYYLDDIHINNVVVADTIYESVCNNQDYIGHGITIPASQMTIGNNTFSQTVKATTAGTMDSIITLNIYKRAEISTTIFDTICSGLPYNKDRWQIAHPTTRRYFNTFDSAAACGCDSTVELYLTVIPSYVVIYDTICTGDVYQFGTRSLTSAGTYTNYSTSKFGCSDTTTLYLFVVDTISVTNASICQGQSYEFEGRYYTQGGIYHIRTVGAHGCPLDKTLNLTIANTDSVCNVSFCQGGYVQIADTFIYNPGTYTLKRLNALDCNITYHITATQTPATPSHTYDYACEGIPYSSHGVPGLTITEDTVVIINTKTIDAMCDSISMIHLSFIATKFSEFSAKINAGDSYRWNDEDFTEAGDYTRKFQTAEGCDSIVTLHLSYKDVAIENVADLNVLVVPNPVTAGEISFIYGDFTEIMDVEILNSFGQVIDNFVPEEYPIEVKGINAAGIYYIRVTSREGKVSVQKLIVE